MEPASETIAPGKSSFLVRECIHSRFTIGGANGLDEFGSFFWACQVGACLLIIPCACMDTHPVKRKNATNRKGFVNGNHVTKNSNDE